MKSSGARPVKFNPPGCRNQQPGGCLRVLLSWNKNGVGAMLVDSQVVRERLSFERSAGYDEAARASGSCLARICARWQHTC